MKRRKRDAIILGTAYFTASILIGIAAILRYQASEKPIPIIENISSEKDITHTEDMLPIQTPIPTAKPEDKIYTFLQGPKSWKEKRKWSGSWGKTYMDGSLFGGFGCGFCCMANIYSSLAPYKCSPVDIYDYTKKKTDYDGGRAVAWEYMTHMLKQIGFKVTLRKKPKTYESFQADIAKSQCAIVLVSSYNDASYWKDTPGHYVTIFLYDINSDKVFLADSGQPKRNRHWVSLKKIYQALKTSSPKQYLNVFNYNENNDGWKHEKAEGNWVEH